MSHHSNATSSFLLILAAAILQLAGCDGGRGHFTGVGSCNRTKFGDCVELIGSDFNARFAERVCEQQGSTFRVGACPTEGRVGSCLVDKGGKTESIYRFYTTYSGYRQTPAEAAQAQCAAARGEWIAN